MTDHPITPTRKLIVDWASSQCGYTDAARWGADRELEACCAWIQGYAECGDSLRAARRPKPPSRKQRALDALTQIEDQYLSPKLAAEIRNALEGLPDD